MSATGRSSQALVIDANLAVWAVLPILQGKDGDAASHIARWSSQDIALAAPTWWTAECTSAIRTAVHYGVISPNEARQAIDDVYTLHVELVLIDSDLCKAALDWAQRLKQVRAYDAIYVALAERLDIEFWTADRWLANAGAQLKLGWIRWIGAE
jgi:predicted nucleic acid-binding protein